MWCSTTQVWRGGAWTEQKFCNTEKGFLVKYHTALIALKFRPLLV